MKILCTLAAVIAAVILAPASPAHADDPLCDFSHTCSYDPPYNGPLMPTWDVPGTYGGWTTNPVICNPVSYSCRQFVTP
ncbi:hypothetical protein ACAG26_20835 [Mycobacterium sp. pUA109]|uniref:hypothetical protein n=1 Tax=Mycobacterium sp. pUA109 TaxID=3238982 RepID=UPI00351B0E4C